MKFFSKYFSLSVAAISFVLSSSFSHADQVTAGSTVMLSVTADGTAPFTYQWKKDGSNLAGSNGSSLTIANIQRANEGSYSVSVTNSAGSTVSDISSLTVALPPVITAQPSSQSVISGASVTFTVSANGTPEPTYQWRKNGINISGATGRSYTLSKVTSASAGNYSVVATNSVSSVASTNAQLTVTTEPTTPVNRPNSATYGATTFPSIVRSGEVVSFTYAVTNTGTKEWGANHYLGLRDAGLTNLFFASLGGLPVGGSVSANLSFKAPMAPGTYTYYVQGLENGVEWFSSRATLTLIVEPSNAIEYNTTTFPYIVTAGTTVNFSCDVKNTGAQAWGANHYLGLRDAGLTNLFFASLDGVSVGESSTLNFSFVAPSTPGTYTYYVQGLENGVEWFSTRSTLTLIVPATPLANAMKYNTSNFPLSVAGDSTVTFTYNVTNTGTKSWGTNHYLGLRDADFNNLSFASVSGVSIGGSTTQSFSFKAPTIPGTYTYYIQGLENGVEWFSTTATLILTVLPDNAMSFGTTTFPVQTVRGAPVTFTYNVRNTGTQSWGSAHYLALRDATRTNLFFASLNGVTVGGNTTVSLSFIAPSAPGIYTYYVQGLEYGIEWFDKPAAITLTVL